MSELCAKCSAELPVGAGRCPQCGALVKPPGLLRRLRDKFNFKVNFSVNTQPGLADKPGTHVYTSSTHHETFKILDKTTGETKEYHSLDDLPAEYRDKLTPAMLEGKYQTSTHITYIGADGVKHVYKSMEEVPDEYWLTLSKMGLPGAKVVRKESYTFVGPDGVKRTYNSLGEVPPDVRAMMEKARRPPESK